MTYSYKTNGTCSREVKFDIIDGLVYNVQFSGGCNGNLKGIAALAEGMKVDEVIRKLNGIKCGFKNTSCPDQFARALREIKTQEGD